MIRIVPIFVREHGITRGLQPASFLVDKFLHANTSGEWHWTYAPAPYFVTSQHRGLYLENTEYSIFDMTSDTQVCIRVFSNHVKGHYIAASNPLQVVEWYTKYTGRMKMLPDWIHNGAIVGLQGGTERVVHLYDRLKQAGIPVAALWLQDWVSKRMSLGNSRLWWNWELDKEWYPNWEQLITYLDEHGTKMLTYINPYVTNVTTKHNVNRNLYAEGVQMGYLIKDTEGKVIQVNGAGDFSAGLLDFTNPQAREWYKQVMVYMIKQTKASGWMSDFGESLPLHAKLHSGIDAAKYHNSYPTEWSALNAEAIREVYGKQENDIVFFSRSGFTKSPSYTTLLWTGDQLQSWDEHAGIKTAVVAMISSGLSGYQFSHSDIGGYVTIDQVPFWKYVRTKEMRWIELAAFTSVFRTHEGIKPASAFQVYDDTDMLQFFARGVKLYSSWKDYRVHLCQEATKYGYPIMRPLFFHFWRDSETYTDRVKYQYLLGSKMMIAPVLDSNVGHVRVYFPSTSGPWIHLWTQQVYNEGREYLVASPIGYPAVFFRARSPWASSMIHLLLHEHVLDMRYFANATQAA